MSVFRLWRVIEGFESVKLSKIDNPSNFEKSVLYFITAFGYPNDHASSALIFEKCRVNFYHLNIEHGRSCLFVLLFVYFVVRSFLFNDSIVLLYGLPALRNFYHLNIEPASRLHKPNA